MSNTTRDEPQKDVCPNCGGDLSYYHSSIRYGDGITRAVCKKNVKDGRY